MEWRLQALLISLHLPIDTAAISQNSWTSVLSSSRAWFHSSLLHIHSQAQSAILMSLHTWLHLILPCQHCLALVPGLPRCACFNFVWTVNIENVGGLELRLHCHRCFCHNIITSCISVPVPICSVSGTILQAPSVPQVLMCCSYCTSLCVSEALLPLVTAHLKYLYLYTIHHHFIIVQFCTP